MKPVTQISKLALIGLLGLGSAVAVVSCSAPPEEQAQVEEGPGVEDSDTPAITAETGEEEAVDTAESEQPLETVQAEGGNIVEVITSNEQFSTLATAVEAAGLTETLSEGSYTVFAPTNEAFEALPPGTLDELLQPENQEQLVKVLQYHVLPQEVTSGEITPGNVATVEGAQVDISVDDATKAVKVNDAKVVQPDIEASNGVIHVVNEVILPPQS
ncbi:MAG: fasciclin domain-containing protein [Oscillatoria sp. PMC 1051.18]|nr:fasciclin domain-containing protein [Oscillatoria sp. PMC 1050.18]MEC5029824.1 fasciclin domain-containing protein [Oscillatoria sp. PMC 1051.18]